MLYYFYDGSFEGLLTAIYDSYYRKEIPDRIISRVELQESMFVDKVYINTDGNKAAKVYESIRTKISEDALKNCFYVFLSETKDKDTVIYKYLRKGWKIGKNVNLNLSDDTVLSVYKICRRVTREVQLFVGLVRFECTNNGVYYAQIEPDNDIVGLLASHFVERLSDEYWIIHDLKRSEAVVYNKKEWVITDLSLEKPFEFLEEEKKYQELWKEYYVSASIKSRVNPKAQKSHMPVRYWKHLIEKRV